MSVEREALAEVIHNTFGSWALAGRLAEQREAAGIKNPDRQRNVSRRIADHVLAAGFTRESPDLPPTERQS